MLAVVAVDHLTLVAVQAELVVEATEEILVVILAVLELLILAVVAEAVDKM
jgi:hypothetical protein